MKPFELFLLGALPGLAYASAAVNVTIFAQTDCVHENQRGFLELNFDGSQAYIDNCYDIHSIGSTWTTNTNTKECRVQKYPKWGCTGLSAIPLLYFGPEPAQVDECQNLGYSSVRVTCLSDAFPDGLARKIWGDIMGGDVPKAVDFPV